LLKAPVRVGERDLFVKASIGISVYPEDGADFDTLLRNADVALYQAKNEGRGNGQLYALSLHAAAMARLETEGGLRRALERGELFLEYQPARDRAVNRVNGVDGAGMHGALEVCGALGLLQMCHVGRLSGALEATHAARTIRMTFETGRLAAATSERAKGREALMEFLAWTEGRFAFHPGATAGDGPISEPMDFLMLEACRILDETAAARLTCGSRSPDERPTRRAGHGPSRA